jgi:glycosyltransferase 2 family protein
MENVAGTIPRMKRAIITAVQAAVTIALLYWIFRDDEKRALMWETLQGANWWWFVPGLAALGIMTVLQTYRWLWLLRVQDISPSFRRTYAINLIGMFFNLFLPGGTGGDLIKMYLVSREAPGKRAASVLSVFMDRVVGLLALIAIAGVVSLFAFDQLWAQASLRGLLITLAFIVGSAIGFMVFVFLIERFHLAKKTAFLASAQACICGSRRILLHICPRRRSIVGRISHQPAHACDHLSVLLLCGPGFVRRGFLFADFHGSAHYPHHCRAADQRAGLGVREQLFKVTMGALYGVPGGVAVLVGFTGFMLSVVWGAVGGPDLYRVPPVQERWQEHS